MTTEAVPTSFLRRLTELHLPECDPESEHGFWAHPTALLHADLFAALKLKRADAQWDLITTRTNSYFQRARHYATTETGDAVDEWEVSRDLARFSVSMGKKAQALQEYRSIVDQESSSGVTAATSVLDLSDLRRAASLAAEEEPRAQGQGERAPAPAATRSEPRQPTVSEAWRKAGLPPQRSA